MEYSDPSTSLKSSDNDDEEAVAIAEEERDEVKEVRNASLEDNRRIRNWRLAVATVILVTAITVTYVTYSNLRKEQRNNFKKAFEQFSGTVADAALQQQKDIRNVYNSFANTLTAHVQSSSFSPEGGGALAMEWPFVTLPLFESYAQEVLQQSRTEIFHVDNLVTRDQKEAYLAFANSNYPQWVEESHLLHNGALPATPLNVSHYHPYFTKLTNGTFKEDTEDRDFYIASWQFSPPPIGYGMINWNLYSTPDAVAIIDTLLELKTETLISEVRPYRVSQGIAFTEAQHAMFHDKLPGNSTMEHPHSFYRIPVRARVHDPDSPVVAVISVGMGWDASMQDLLPQGVAGIMAVLKNDCNQSFTYEVNGDQAFFRGVGDLHEFAYNDMKREINLAIHSHPQFDQSKGHCRYRMEIYPSQKFEASYDSNTPERFAGLVAITFIAMAVVFFVYDMYVRTRNEKLVMRAARSNAIVSSLFPGTIRDQLITGTVQVGLPTTKHNLHKFMSSNNVGGANDADWQAGSKPLAEFFLETTVLFADIVGFTAWSSTREPSQVLILLESCYAAFDVIAKQRRIYKVETVGDCYVAVSGIPDPRKDHAVAMARFARDILTKMHAVTRKLEVILGPDTADLELRIGVHSGAVTAGVLRGERARFQLFGDTVNTCARMESTGMGGKIHVSKDTADQLLKFGKGNWIEQRPDLIEAKGKGLMQTYWLSLNNKRKQRRSNRENQSVHNSDAASSCMDVSENSNSMLLPELEDRKSRCVEWNVEILSDLLKQVMAHREASSTGTKTAAASVLPGTSSDNNIDIMSTPFEEVREIITLPAFDHSIARNLKKSENITLDPTVLAQLQDYVTCIANMYRSNPFHNFEHASHVVMSVVKLMNRIVAPSHIEIDENDISGIGAATLHDHTYGITSDPLTRFACAFSALIHDVDHTGVPNTQLATENESLAARYDQHSIAEQNSLDLAWELLMDERYTMLRQTLCTTKEELQRFRQLVVNSVMATDIMDKQLKALRNDRWEKAFTLCSDEGTRDAVNRKATIVIEHLIQASDVSHTMQHWHVYLKWNERLFQEMYKAYEEGRAEKNPTEFWYKGEIGFLDFYVIPLAKKLKECGVFGISGDEYLNYAEQNRREWENRGQNVVDEFLRNINEC